MSANGQHRDASSGDQVLRWQGRVLAAEDLRHSLNGHREVLLAAGTIVTPLAAEQLRAHGIQITRHAAAAAVQPETGVAWGFAQDRPHAAVQSAVQALGRDGLVLRELKPEGQKSACAWARAVAECVARGECRGGVLFCQDTGLVCCVANKVPGLRAVAVFTVAQAARAVLTLATNLAAVEMPGRTLFEVRQILRTLCTSGAAVCPDGVGCTLRELEGHAHR
ncbi:MAG TPA: RpiB/LacA/LacB family sugar-phosphate isomerase [Gemmataceae bacterium]|jgi:ribose 5-phosphate isomerase RpiB|nr:RpiB/LacA/LacB family sugar-phosphate isomerase [Gemmataceae bacterium]